MNKNEIILITLLTLMQNSSEALYETTYSDHAKVDKGDTIFMTLVNQINAKNRADYQSLMDAIMDGSDEELFAEIKRLLGLEKDGLL